MQGSWDAATSSPCHGYTKTVHQVGCMNFVTYCNIWLKCYITFCDIVADGKRGSNVLARAIDKLWLIIFKKLKKNTNNHSITNRIMEWVLFYYYIIISL